MGLSVLNPEGDSLGEIADLVVERTGNVPYAAIEFGGILGFGERWYYIPMGAFSLDRVNFTAVVDVDDRMLEEMPGFEEGELPDTAEPGWDLEIRAYWYESARPASELLAAEIDQMMEAEQEERREKPGAILASRLLDYRVVNPEGRHLGEVDDLMIDLENDRLTYPIISFGGFLELGEKHFPVPADKLAVNASEQTLVLDVEVSLFQDAPGYQKQEWPDTADLYWPKIVAEYWK
jgi:sporulation protein YlmC with PRC-barrel domain